MQIVYGCMAEITVCINNFNRAALAEYVVKSIPRDVKIIVMDAGSPREEKDRLARACDDLGARFLDLEIPGSMGHPNQANIQLYTSKNLALKEVRTEFVVFNDGDYTYLPGALEESLMVYKALPQVGLMGHFPAPIAGCGWWSAAEWPIQWQHGHQCVGKCDVLLKKPKFNQLHAGVEVITEEKTISMLEMNTVGGMSTMHRTQQLRDLGGMPVPPNHRSVGGPGSTGDGDICDVVHNAGLKMYVPESILWGMWLT